MGAGRSSEVLGVSPSTDGHEHLHVPILFLEKVELPKAAIDIISASRQVARVWINNISTGVTKMHVSRRIDIGESI